MCRRYRRWGLTQEQLEKEEPEFTPCRLYLDADTTPAEASTLILAAFGATYVNQLIDALIDLFEIQPNRGKEE